MRELFNKVHTLFNHRPLPELPLDVLESFDYKLQTQSLNWQADEIDMVLSAEKNKILTTARPLNRLDIHQTIIVGVDLNSNSLLLDDFFPRLQQPTTGTQYTLTLISDEGALVLKIELDQKIPIHGGPCLLAKILEKQRISDRRQHPRTEFLTDHMPRVRMLAPMVGEIKGVVRNLSTGGLMILSHTRSKPLFYTPTAELTLEFDENYCVKSKVHIKSLKFIRKPHRHCLIGALFVGLSEEQKDQIDTFIRAHQFASTELSDY